MSQTLRSRRFGTLVGAAAASLAISSSVANAASPRPDTLTNRHPQDLRELQSFDNEHPEAEVLFDRGERALAAGRVEEAAGLFERVMQQIPDSGLAARRVCQTRSELGQRFSAMEACHAAVRVGHTPMDFRALVGAIMSAPPTPEQLNLALAATEQAKTRTPDQPAGYAAQCDIAIRLGDQAMFNQCVTDLERVAPGHYETLRVSEYQRKGGELGVMTGWLLIGAAMIGTALHAVVSWLRRGARKSASAAAASCLALGLLSGTAHADGHAGVGMAAGGDPKNGISKWKIDPQDPVSSVPTPEQRDSSPLEYGYFLMDLTLLAENAEKAEDFASAAKYYEAIVKAVPDAAIGYRKGCAAYIRANDKDKAVAMCASALSAPGTILSDYTNYATLVTERPQLSKDDIDALDRVITHLQATPDTTAAAALIECQLGTRLEDSKRLQHCSEVLLKKDPAAPKTLSYAWAAAINQGDLNAAKRVIEQAKKTSMEPKAIELMQKTTATRSSFLYKISKYWKVEAGVLALAALALFGWQLSKGRKLSVST